MSIQDGIDFFVGKIIAEIGFVFVIGIILLVVAVIVAIIEAHKDKKK